MTWQFDAAALRTIFEETGYDVDVSDASLPGGGGSLTARLERGDKAHLITVDAGGRIKVTLTRLTAKSEPRTTVLAGVTLRGIVETTTVLTLFGHAASAEQLKAVLEELDSLPHRLARPAPRRYNQRREH